MSVQKFHNEKTSEICELKRCNVTISRLLTFLRGIRRWLVDSPKKDQ